MSRKIPMQSPHFCKANKLKRVERTIYEINAEGKDEFYLRAASISCAKRFMRTGRELRS